MKKFCLLLAVTFLVVVSCDNNENREREGSTQGISNLTFTTCNHNATNKDATEGINVQFSNTGIQITHNGLAVTCDFDTVIVSYTFDNGVLRITEQGEPNSANCICYTDVSYTINNISQNEVNVIFVNGVQVYCHNQQNTEDDWLIHRYGDSDTNYQNQVFVVNTFEELYQHIGINNEAMPFSFNPDTETLLVLHGRNNYGVCDVTSMVGIVYTLPEQIDWNVYVQSGMTTVINPYIYIKKIGKVSCGASDVNLDLQTVPCIAAN
ncbi:MAG: hypothetical protein LBR28_04375 [Bacteroidales bacterium]|jgi:hypothetical protein|nr:hypothetical protein [Bacteroidales bacterium]